MSMVRMQSPEGCTSFAHQGYPMKLDADGSILVDPRHAGDFTAHGFVPTNQERKTAEGLQADRVFAADPREPRPFGEGMDPVKAALIDRLGALPLSSLERFVSALENDAGAGQAPAPQPNPQPPQMPQPQDEPEASEGVPASGKLTDGQIDRMTKAQATAWLKEREIPVLPPIDIDVLREKVRHANSA